MGVVILPGDTEGTLELRSANDEVSGPDEVFHVVFGDLPRDRSAQELGLHTELAVAITVAASDPARRDRRAAGRPGRKVANCTPNHMGHPASGGVAVASETDRTATVAQAQILRSRWARNGVVRTTVRAVSVTQTAAIPTGKSEHPLRVPMAVDSDGVPGSVWLSVVSVSGSGPVSAHPLEQLSGRPHACGPGGGAWAAVLLGARRAARGAVRSCRRLDSRVAEFETQGLELDASLVCWGPDFLPRAGTWDISRMVRHSPQNSRMIRDPLRLRTNAYRVLLARARDACVILVPAIEEGGSDLLRPVCRHLRAAGIRDLQWRTIPVAVAPSRAA